MGGLSAEATRLLETLAQTGATDGQAIVFSTAENKWKPGTVAGGGAGAIEKVETIVPGSDVSSVNFTGLDGDTDGLYILKYYWTATDLTEGNFSDYILNMMPNGTAPSAPGPLESDDRMVMTQGSWIQTVDSTSLSTLNRSPSLGVSNLDAGKTGTPQVAYGNVEFYAKRVGSEPRLMLWDASMIATDSANFFVRRLMGATHWGQDPGANITSIKLETREFNEIGPVVGTTPVTGIGSGSRFTLYKSDVAV